MASVSRMAAVRVCAITLLSVLSGGMLLAGTTATMQVSPTTMSFSATAGDSQAKVQYISVTKSGGGQLRWKAANLTGAGWLTVSPAQGTGAATISVTATAASLPASSYSATVRFTQSTGTTVDVPVTLVVGAAATPPPPSNQPPTIQLTSPSNGASFTEPATITVSATAADSDGTVSRVDYYANNTLLGTSYSAPYTLSWPNVAAGSYSIFAQATDNTGAQTPSAPSGVKVVAATPTPAYDRAIYPGESIQSVVNAYPQGTRFLLKAGTHVQQQVTPKSGNAFYGETGTILDGQNVTAYAFETLASTPSNVVIQGLVIKNYATPSQRGAIQGDNGVNWIVQDNEICYNAYQGLRAGDGMQILRNKVHHNGRVGMGGFKSDNVVVDGNEVYYNNPSHVAEDPALAEASGMKWFSTLQLVVRNNNVHDNWGVGIWMDHNWPTALIESNTVANNHEAGIWNEVSYDAIIRNNTVTNNGSTGNGWLGNSGIQVSNSPNVQIYGNQLKNNGNGIGVMQASGYPDGPYGPNVVQNLDVHDNNVTMTIGHTGLAQNTGDTSIYTSRNNRFYHNTYYLGPNAAYFMWNEQAVDQRGWQGYGQDLTGTFTRF